MQRISIHAPRAGSDALYNGHIPRRCKFQSTLPVRGATYTPPPHEPQHNISIHAPRAGSDSFIGSKSPDTDDNFNPRSPCGERQDIWFVGDYSDKFQSTLPVRGATRTIRTKTMPIRNFNPRSPCGERRVIKATNLYITDFNPRSPCGERRREYSPRFYYITISIHAPRAGSDSNIAQISDDRAAILRHGFQTISPPTAEKSLSANKKLFLMPFSAREPPGFFMFTAGSRPAAGQKINVSVTSIEGLAPICFTLPSYAEPIT